jgi:hypothetical protein
MCPRQTRNDLGSEVQRSTYGGVPLVIARMSYYAACVYLYTRANTCCDGSRELLRS